MSCPASGGDTHFRSLEKEYTNELLVHKSWTFPNILNQKDNRVMSFKKEFEIKNAKLNMQELYSIESIQDIVNEFWKVGYGSIAVDESMFVQKLISGYMPKNFLEIGMASGMSGGLIASFMEKNQGERFVTLDHDNTFFGDSSKENGFLINDIYKGSDVEVQKRPFSTSLDLESVGLNFEMSFIDANHQHPWPIIDTLCLFPYLIGDKIIIHHDLELFLKQDVVFGIGPKYLWDQFPEKNKIKSTANNGNIFALKLQDMSLAELEGIAINAFSLPWSLRAPLQPTHLEKILSIFEKHYSADLCDAFARSTKKFNVLDRFRSGL